MFKLTSHLISSTSVVFCLGSNYSCCDRMNVTAFSNHGCFEKHYFLSELLLLSSLFHLDNIIMASSLLRLVWHPFFCRNIKCRLFLLNLNHYTLIKRSYSLTLETVSPSIFSKLYESFSSVHIYLIRRIILYFITQEKYKERSSASRHSYYSWEMLLELN